MSKRHSSIDAILRFFEYEHLPPHLQNVSLPFAGLAVTIADMAPNDPETTVCLRKLLEAKDCAVRAMLSAPPAKGGE